MPWSVPGAKILNGLSQFLIFHKRPAGERIRREEPREKQHFESGSNVLDAVGVALEKVD
jgi:hypothetical protein